MTIEITAADAARAGLCTQRDALLAQLASPDAGALAVHEWLRLQHGAIELSKRIFAIDQAAAAGGDA